MKPFKKAHKVVIGNENYINFYKLKTILDSAKVCTVNEDGFLTK